MDGFGGDEGYVEALRMSSLLGYCALDAIMCTSQLMKSDVLAPIASATSSSPVPGKKSSAGLVGESGGISVLSNCIVSRPRESGISGA